MPELLLHTPHYGLADASNSLTKSDLAYNQHKLFLGMVPTEHSSQSHYLIEAATIASLMPNITSSMLFAVLYSYVSLSLILYLPLLVACCDAPSTLQQWIDLQMEADLMIRTLDIWSSIIHRIICLTNWKPGNQLKTKVSLSRVPSSIHGEV